MNKKAFTLVEIIVSITIFMIVMVSVLQIFLLSSNLSNKIDINRQIQENIKNLTETIAEDMRKTPILWVKKNIIDNYKLSNNFSIENGSLLKIWSNSYYLSDSENSLGYSRIEFDDIDSKCASLKNNCFLVKNDSKLTNSWVSFEKLNFTIMWEKNRKLVLNFTIRPSTKKWISSKIIKDSKLIFQTTISERFIKTN